MNPFHVYRSLCTSVTDEGVSVFAHLPRLKHLDIACCNQVTDEGIKLLARLPLIHLDLLGCTQVTDAGIAALSGIRTLKHLDIAHCAITDRVFDHLTKCKLT